MGEEIKKGEELDPQAGVEHIIKTAQMMGVEVDETDVAHWLTAMAASKDEGQDWSVDEDSQLRLRQQRPLPRELPPLHQQQRRPLPSHRRQHPHRRQVKNRRMLMLSTLCNPVIPFQK